MKIKREKEKRKIYIVVYVSRVALLDSERNVNLHILG